MSSSHGAAVTPATPHRPTRNGNGSRFSTTPPVAAIAGAIVADDQASSNHAPAFSSPSPRTRLGARDQASPGSRAQRPDSQRQYQPQYPQYYQHYHHRSDSHEAVNGSAAPIDASDPSSAPLAAHRSKPSSAIYTTSPPNRPPSTSLAHVRPHTSSLLPPARITVDAAASQDAPPSLRSAFQEPTRELEPPQQSTHSRSSSAGGLSDSLRNLNRWSASTTSSRASNFAGFTRRVSNEVLGAAFGSPGRKLHRSRPSTASGSPRSVPVPRSRVESPAPSPIPPLQSLPIISAGPSLEDELESSVLARLSSIQRPNHNRRPSDDPGLYWDGTPASAEDQILLVREPENQQEQQEDKNQQQLHEQRQQTENSELGAATATAAEGNMPYSQPSGQARGHSRNRSTGAKGSADTTSSTRSREKERERTGKPPSQKAMLSKALQKAHTAVQLDNAQNFEGARRAYAEACDVLQQVLLRTPGEEDRKKLEAIHATYTTRIVELDEQLVDLDQPVDKELPQRPESNDIDIGDFGGQVGVLEAEGASVSALNRGPIRESVVPSYSLPASNTSRGAYTSKAPPNLALDAPKESMNAPKSYLTEQYSLQSAFSKARLDGGSRLRPAAEDPYIPPPLSPRRPLSPAKLAPQAPEPPMTDFTMSGALPGAAPPAKMGHHRGNSHESVSWLDPIDESGSSASSNHSRSSSMQIKRKHIRAPSGNTEAEFDAALDDAIEAAYNDGYEPDTQYSAMQVYQNGSQEAMANTLRKVELARERVRESEREALELANEREKRLRLQQQLEDEEYRRQEGMGDDFYVGNDSEEEERVLEEMSRGYMIEDFAFGRQGKSVPRESDSSGLTSRTWHSSMGSNPPTATTALTSVSEASTYHRSMNPGAPLMPPPAQALPQLPSQPLSAGSQGSNQSVRSRRLSGQNAKQLKIETAKIASAAPPPATTAGPPPKSGSYIVQQRQALSAGPSRLAANGARPTPSPVPGASAEGTATPPLPSGAFVTEDQPRSGSPSVVRPGLRKNFSSSSLKSIKSRNYSISHVDDGADLSPGTPLSSQFAINGSSSRLPALPSLPTPLATTFKDRTTGGNGGMYLFDDGFHSPDTPGTPNPLANDAPVALEPCPNESMLRPFWLMRCLYQTLCHPRGGYISNKLFVPRDVWRVKGVKLKNIEDKISNCDLLTAALQKLARVDTCDADAVLEEMQALEGVLEQVQATLTRRLGNEVGVQGSGTMFRDATGVDSEAASMPRSGSVAGKGSSFSWRRLRSKNSSANLPALATSYGGKGGSGGTGSSGNMDGTGTKDIPLPSLPMTNHPTSRPTKRDVASVMFSGPNANYMGSLARLFDAAQAIDQIARQVDDPGLRHADKTQVGLELSTRHAAEFFAFYIVRFVLSDLTLLMDKFLKRGTEWVLA